MDGPDHYRAAEKLFGEAESSEASDPRAMWYLELAKLQTALAQVAATALAHRDGREWFEAAGTKLSGYT
jgi:cytochrome c-type biogenesis protein CcmH/NrfG